ncbi:hypothetical protein B0H19DRAFT_1070876 [Mycena capillaripes]|nr:hypothetical protein B0H19DRAFT_1070876 [Mycena capillaripes]
MGRTGQFWYRRAGPTPTDTTQRRTSLTGGMMSEEDKGRKGWTDRAGERGVRSRMKGKMEAREEDKERGLTTRVADFWKFGSRMNMWFVWFGRNAVSWLSEITYFKLSPQQYLQDGQEHPHLHIPSAYLVSLPIIISRNSPYALFTRAFGTEPHAADSQFRTDMADSEPSSAALPLANARGARRLRGNDLVTYHMIIT